MNDPEVDLRALFETALTHAFGRERAETDPALRRSDHADFQANVAMSLKKELGKAPRDIAAAIVAHLPENDVIEEATLAGPGFINIKLKKGYLSRALEERLDDPRVGVREAPVSGTVVIDYSAPNIAKEMHVGHLRSTIIGDALARLFEFRGHRVIRQNHLGDWGTPFGMLIEHLLDLGERTDALSMGDLNGFYKEARQKFDAAGEGGFAKRSKDRVVLLQAGDAETRRLWKTLCDESKRYFQAVYDKLGVTLREGDAAPESLYNDALAGTLLELEGKGLARVDQGALCAFPEGFKGKSGDPLPLIIRKQDGGYGYATTDLAAVRYRTQVLHATRILYVVGAPQAQHLSMVFAIASAAGWLDGWAPEHVAFGSVLGEDGKMYKTRSGDTVKLMDLLEEAETRARPLVLEKNAERVAKGEPTMTEEELDWTAHAIGMAAIKYADLSSDRVKDYVFDWSRMLASEGNTGPYLQYAHARPRSILRRAGWLSDTVAPIQIETPEERALALELLAFERAVVDVERSLEPHRMTTYLYGLASAFNAFFAACPVLKADEPVRSSRLALCQLTANVLKQGLSLLGIDAPLRM